MINMIKPKFFSKPTKFKLSYLSLILLNSWFSYAYANEYVEFDADFLFGSESKKNIDVQRFSYENAVPAGEYIADVYLNEKLLGRINIQYSDVPEQKRSVLCATENLLALLDLKSEAFADKPKTINGHCHSFSELVPEATVNFDMGQLRLDVNIAQALITQRPQGYISPAQWQDGTPVAFVRYDATHYRYKYSDIDAQQTYLGIDAGVNLFGWALRHRGSQTWTDQQKQSYQRIATYAKHDVPLLRGQFTIGDFYTSGRLMDSIAIRGVQLESDDRMLAASERYYAPVIRGVANTNAIVSVRQNGNLLREVSVPAGAFSIDDLFPTGYGGDLEVEVLEANGEKRKFTVPYTATAQLIRPGYSRYQLSAGRYRYDNETLDNVAQATWQYGLTNNVTLNLGAILAKNYHSELIGLAVNTPIGAFSGNATFSNAKIVNSQQKYKGYNLYFSYNTHIEPTNTNVTLAAYRYLSRKYYSLQDTILANNRDFVDRQEIDMSSYSYRPKNQFQVTVSQVFKDNWGSIYVNGSTYTYWDSNEKRNEYQIGYGNSYKKLNYSLSFSQGKTSNGKNDRRVYLSLSLPLGNSVNSAYVSQTLNYHKENGYYASTSLYGSLGEQGKYNYNIAVSKQKDNSNISFNNNYSSPQARLSASWSRDNKGSQQISFGASGAVVAHPKGITLSNDLGDSFAIIHAKGAKGALINGSVGNKIDYFGNGIVPYIEPYAMNYVGLDGNSLPSTVELSATEQSVIPRANQAILVNFETEQGAVVFFELTNNEKELPPLGTEVFDQNNQSVGVVAQGGTIYTRGIAESGELKLSWGETRCHINYQLPPESDNTMPVIVPVQCQFY